MNTQDPGGNAKAYQMRQALTAIEKVGRRPMMPGLASPDASHYTYRVGWSAEDGEHVATVVEFPSLSVLDPNMLVALEALRDLVADLVADMAANDEQVPEPLSDRVYSGRFTCGCRPGCTAT
ncbi:hypothetical protein [Nocardioides guangzhouensis]|uniref:hypothetical protein n=1 Tax=Nocardioides guangzhouensis TaxID=2497878 RepID=UPI001FEC6CF6|nr:hypothetical protein [Nocardioides guangzhouensis]